jgi:hydroxypyruvate reductase
MKIKLLQHTDLQPLDATTLNTRYDVHPLWQEADSQAFLAQYSHEFTGYVTSARFGVSEATLAALPNLKVISSFDVGTETLSLGSAHACGVAVGYTPTVLNDCVADTAFALLIDVARRFSAANRFVHRGDWLKGQYPLTTRISGKCLGILSLGISVRWWTNAPAALTWRCATTTSVPTRPCRLPTMPR